MAQETIYIPENQKDTWAEIKQAGKDQDRGIGYLLLEAWRKAKEVK